MGEEISAVTEWIRDCSNGVNKACGESPTGGWLVVSFSDPGIGQVVGPTLDVRMIINALTNYIPTGGGDCPEMAMGGIEKLVNQIPNQSQENVCKIYFFSDATPKDSNRQGEVKALLQRKGCQFIPILTGCCGVCPSVCDSVSQDYCRDRVTDYVGSSTPRNEPPGAMIGTGRRPYSFFSLAEATGSPGIISAPNSITAAQLKNILVTVAPTMGFGTWSAWVTGPCSVTCGQGISTRTRHCNDELRRKISNEMCPGPWKQTVTCLPGPSCQTRNSVCTTTTRSMLDVVFLIDGSRSIEGNDFQEVKQWILQVVDQLRPSLVGATMKPRIIIVQYSRSVQIEVEQTIQASSAEIKVTVEAITQMNSGTNTYRALRFINSDVVPKTRPGSVKILIAITDGQASDNRDADAINEARSNFDVMLAIGVGDQVNDDQLEDLSHKTEPIMINSFTSIGNITESVVEVSCAPASITPIGYVWGKWTATRCSKTCGGGFVILSRPCLDGSGRTVPATFCPGGASSGSGRMACNTVTCRPAHGWGKWSSSGCSQTCGGGTITYSRPCMDGSGQTVASSLCPGGSSNGYASMTCNTMKCRSVSSVCTATTRSMLDVVFLIDGSGSIEANDFQQVKQWILQVVDQLRPALVGATMKPRIIIVQYSSNVEIEIEQTIQASSAEIKVSVEAITQMDSSTNTYSALRFINSDVVPKTRPGSVKILIAITDGQASDNRDADAINETRSNFDVMLAIGVGDQVNDDQLKDLSHKSEPIMINSFTSIGNITDSVVEVSCASTSEPTKEYVWGKWSSSGCSQTCGGGTITYTRPCMDGSQQIVSATLCRGGLSSGSATTLCNTMNCPSGQYTWGKWAPTSCSRSCGGGTQTYSRPCVDSSRQVVAPTFCPSGSSAVPTPCNSFACPATASRFRWSGTYYPLTQCSKTCNDGTQKLGQYCFDNVSKQNVGRHFCRGTVQPTKMEECNQGDCSWDFVPF